MTNTINLTLEINEGSNLYCVIKNLPHETYGVDGRDYLEIIHNGKSLGFCDGLGIQEGDFTMELYEELVIFKSGVNLVVFLQKNIDRLIFIKRGD